jgi:ubiquitin-conjugating enzyme E2 M
LFRFNLNYQNQVSIADLVQVVSPGALRIQTDMSELELPQNCSLNLPNKEDLMNFTVSIVPDDGFWKDGTFVFSFNIPENYPHKPPKVLCQTKVEFATFIRVF